MVETSATALFLDESVTAAIHLCFIYKHTVILKRYKEYSHRSRHEVRKVRQCEKGPKRKCKYSTKRRRGHLRNTCRSRACVYIYILYASMRPQQYQAVDDVAWKASHCTQPIHLMQHVRRITYNHCIKWQTSV